MDDACIICFRSLEELGGAIELPCRCAMLYCQCCWDRTLATSLSSVGLPKCPSCRVVIRADYDARQGRLVFSRVADATLRYENWLEAFDRTLSQHGVTREDEGTKFIARTQSGHLTKLFVMFAFQESAKAVGELWRQLDSKQAGKQEWFVQNCRGEAVERPREPSLEEFPVQVRYPKTVEQPLTEQDPSSYPLTLTFKEYVVTIDVGLQLPETFRLEDVGVVVADDVGLAQRWKDSRTGVCLHPGDRILEVNGLSDVESILLLLNRAEPLKVRLQQQGSIFKTNVFNAQDDMRNRLQQQAKPRQQELLRRGGGHKPACVCGGELELLQLRDRVKLLLGPSGYLEYAGRRFSAQDLLTMQAVTCDLCHRPIREETLWTCQNGANTILHAQSYDVCVQCFSACAAAETP